MLIGYNNDVEHRGKTFHIQTEDRGSNDHRIETQLFHGGAILDTKITSYEEHVEGLEGKKRNTKIKSIMKASHRSLFRKLLAGKYDEMVGLDPVEKPEEVVEEKAEEFSPGQDRVPQAAVELERDGIEALEKEAKEEGFEDPAGQNHVNLSQLKDKLAGLKKKKKDEVAAEEVAAEEVAAEEVAAEEVAAEEVAVEGGVTERLEELPFETVQVSEVEDGAEPLVTVGVDGVKAWRGCDVEGQELGLTELVEAALR